MRLTFPVAASAFVLFSASAAFAQQDQNPSFNAHTDGDGFVQNDHSNTITGSGLNIIADCEFFSLEPCDGNVAIEQRFNSVSGALIGAGSLDRSGSGRADR